MAGRARFGKFGPSPCHPSSSAHGHSFELTRQTVSQLLIPPYATGSKTLKLTPPPPTHPQKGVNKAPPQPPPTEEGPEEGDAPEFFSDTNNLITIKQAGQQRSTTSATPTWARPSLTYSWTLKGLKPSPTYWTTAKKARGPSSPTPTARSNSKINTARTLRSRSWDIRSNFHGHLRRHIHSNKSGSSSVHANSRAILSALLPTPPPTSSSKFTTKTSPNGSTSPTSRRRAP
eukprot:scaffold18575_cov104-Isochrysis_galbana.AAC.1